MVSVRFDSPDPVLAASVANTLAAKYLEGRNEVRKTGDRSTVEFLRNQSDTLEAQLRAAEEALRRFRERNRVVSLGAEATAQVERLADLETRRTTLDTERRALEDLLGEARLRRLEAGQAVHAELGAGIAGAHRLVVYLKLTVRADHREAEVAVIQDHVRGGREAVVAYSVLDAKEISTQLGGDFATQQQVLRPERRLPRLALDLQHVIVAAPLLGDVDLRGYRRQDPLHRALPALECRGQGGPCADGLSRGLGHGD